MNIKKISVIICLYAFILLSCNKNKNAMKSIQTSNINIVVPDEKTASKIAEAVWLPLYGESIENYRPFTVILKDSNVWIVKGTLHTLRGGVPYIEISKKDGKIINVSHGK